MSLQLSRKEAHEAVLKGQFVKMVLEENARDIDNAIQQKTAGFNSLFWKDRNFSVKGTTLEYSHRKEFRFLDMKTRKTKSGIINKKHYSIHNKPIFGHLNNIIRELHFGFTEAIKQEISQLDNTNI